MNAIDLSYNEVMTLARKAACGAGLPYGIAEEIAAAAVWLSRHGVDGVKMVVAALGRSSPRSIVDGLSAIDRLVAAPAMRRETLFSDCSLLVIAFAGVYQSASPTTFIFRIGTEVLNCRQCDGAALIAFDDATTLEIERLDQSGSEHTVKGGSRRPAPTDILAFSAATLLAEKTYVPASEASRLLGAGAGTTDND